MLVIICSCKDKIEDQGSQFRNPITADSLTLEDFPKGIPVYEPMFSKEIADKVERKELRKSMSYHHLLQIGQYKKVNLETELELDWGLSVEDEQEIKNLKNYHLVDAEKYILKQSKFHRLIIIAEAHTKPEHRVFTRCLLENLYNSGYRHLGLENILPLHGDPAGKSMDSLLNTRGYPTMTAFSGIYTSEPEYSNLIREATDLGFKIFSYERNGSSNSERDTQQAERIIEYMKTIPADEKVICHGGWYHAFETKIPKDREGNYWMAYEYKRMSGDDPFTIYQDAMNDKIASNQQSSPHYEVLRDSIVDLAKPSVLVDNTNRSWQGPGDTIPFDVLTIQPPLDYDKDVPWNNWDCFSCSTDEISFIPLEVVPEIKARTNYILEIRRAYESELATPVYVREVVDITQPITITNCIGDYKVRFRTIDGNEYIAEVRI
ncbi:MAG: hypothetical protein WA957_03735 [Alteraurantiacibacter sp.]